MNDECNDAPGKTVANARVQRSLARYSVYATITSSRDAERVLKFALECGCERFSAFPSDSLPTPAFVPDAEEKMSKFYLGVQALETDRANGVRYSHWAHAWRFCCDAIPLILRLLPTGFSKSNAARLCLYLSEGYESVFLLTNINGTEFTFLNLTQIQMEAFHKLGFVFEFEAPRIARRAFTSADIHIDAPPGISLDELKYDIDRYPRPNGFGWEQNTEAASDVHILKWWTPSQDALLEKWIEKDKWGWRPDHRKLTSGVPEDQIEEFKHNDPKCKTWVWYNVINQFAYARAEAIGLTTDLGRSAWRKCNLCERDFHESTIDVRWLPPEDPGMCSVCLKSWLFQRSREDMSRMEILDYVRDLAILLGRVPPAGYEFSKDCRRFSHDERKKAAQLNARRPTGSCIERECGSWLQALIDSGVLSDGSRKTSRGTQCIANDGHVCLSIAEKTIDDFLHARGILHTREVRYPHSNFRSDFVVGEVFIEYFGLVGNADYDCRVQEKIAFCRECGIQLLEIYPADMASDELLETKLGPILRGSMAEPAKSKRRARIR